MVRFADLQTTQEFDLVSRDAFSGRCWQRKSWLEQASEKKVESERKRKKEREWKREEERKRDERKGERENIQSEGSVN